MRTLWQEMKQHASAIASAFYVGLLVALACNAPARTPPATPPPVAIDSTPAVPPLVIVDTAPTPPVVITPPVPEPEPTPPPVVVTPPPAPASDTTLTVVAIDVKPDAVRLKTGETVQFCPLLLFKGGNVAMPADYHNAPDCVRYYAATSPLHRPTEEQQRIANRACIKWEATGGTITATPCADVET